MYEGLLVMDCGGVWQGSRMLHNDVTWWLTLLPWAAVVGFYL